MKVYGGKWKLFVFVYLLLKHCFCSTRACNMFNPAALLFWEQVSAAVGTRSGEECSAKFFQGAGPSRTRGEKTAVKEKGRLSLSLCCCFKSMEKKTEKRTAD